MYSSTDVLIFSGWFTFLLFVVILLFRRIFMTLSSASLSLQILETYRSISIFFSNQYLMFNLLESYFIKTLENKKMYLLKRSCYGFFFRFFNKDKMVYLTFILKDYFHIESKTISKLRSCWYWIDSPSSLPCISKKSKGHAQVLPIFLEAITVEASELIELYFSGINSN